MTTSKASPPSHAPGVEASIESSLGRLETIVEEIEKTPPSLETLIERYEEGMALLKTCREKLDAAERRIEIITRTGRGEAALEPFEES
jgi:exodeoxyribonuclease VII small subunit